MVLYYKKGILGPQNSTKASWKGFFFPLVFLEFKNNNNMFLDTKLIIF